MYTGSAQATGHHRFLHSPRPGQHRVRGEQPCGHPGGPARQTDHPSADCRRDFQAPQVERSPQRRPVFAAGPGPCTHSDDLSPGGPWEFNPALRGSHYTPESGVRHSPPVSGQCGGCAARGDARAHAAKAGSPRPLPHLQVKGQGLKHRRTVRYVCVDEEEERCRCASESCRSEPQGHRSGHAAVPNGHCGARPVTCEGGEERDSHRDRGREKGGSEEGYNGSHRGFFPTEVPQNHLNQSRRTGPCVPPSGISSKSASSNGEERRRGGSGDVKPKRRQQQQQQQDAVRDQIRQVVTDLEDVLGGLKQVHVEMKEVVEQIDRLTAAIDLSEVAPCGTLGVFNNFDGSAPPGDIRRALPSNHKPAPGPASQIMEEDRIILRTNAPSPVHMASVVKTCRFTPLSHGKDFNRDRPSANGHPPHLHHHNGQTHPEPHPQSLDPKVVIGNSTSASRTQKPPPYPQNGRFGKGPYLPPKPVRTPACPGRGRQSTSMV